MNKKFLSAILFGALMVTSTGTFVSCKDYDDDIENLQGQISANSSAIAELKALIGDGNYVTSISVSGQNLVVNTKNGSTNVPLPKCEDKVGSICTVSEDGELLIDGVATGIKVAESTEENEFLPAVDIVDGEWAVLQEDGSYLSTGVAVSSVAVTGDKQNGYVLTIKDAEGAATVIELPTAASLITSIDVVGDATAPIAVGNTTGIATLMIKKAQFNTDAWASAWGGKREVPADNSVVYGVSSLDVRIDPVSAPAQDVDFYLTNTKNHTLSNLKLYAAATQDSDADAMNSGNINGRAAVTGNGLWTLKMDQFVLSEDDAEDFQEDLNDNTATIVYAVNANKVARSKYNVIVDEDDADALTTIQVVNMASSDAVVAATAAAAQAAPITVNVGQTYKIDEIAGEDGLMWDMFFNAASATAVETYGLVFDDLNRTFTVTKRPDVVTTATAFTLNVYTLDILGNRKVAKYDVSLSAKINAATATYPAVTHNLANFNNNTGSDDYFTLPISTMKSALGDKWTTWANSVDLTKTVVTVHEKSDLSDTGVEVDRHIDGTPAASQATEGLGYYLLTSAPAYTEDVNSLNNIRIQVSPATTATYTVDTQYYIKVKFLDKADASTSYEGGQYINHIVVPVKFTAPTVADQFALKSGYVVDGVVNAYYYNYEEASKEVALIHYFDKWDAEANITLDTQTTLATLSNGTALKSSHLAVLKDQVVAGGAITTYSKIDGMLYLNTDYDMGDDTNRELGYGKNLIVKASNATYDGWKYKTAEQKAYSFTIKLMSPIFEGTIKPVSGSTINVTANAEEGFAITKSMIELADYNKNLYSVVPDANNKNPESEDAWNAAQIDMVTLSKDSYNTYIKNLKMRGHVVESDGTVTQEGAIMVYADPLPNTQATSMKVHVTDCWGYIKTQEVSVTIVKK